MQLSDEFETFKSRCVDAWNETYPEAPALVTDIYKQVGPYAGPLMRMGFFDVRSENWQQWRSHTIHEMSAASGFHNHERVFADGPLAKHENQSYIKRVMIPRINSVISTQMHSVSFIKYTMDHTNIGFESLYLPQKTTGRSEWVMFVSNIRFCLKKIEPTRVDKEDAAVIQLLIAGDTAKEIAIKLGTNYRTIEYRIARLKSLLNAKNTIQLVALLVGNQLSDLIIDRTFTPQIDQHCLERARPE